MFYRNPLNYVALAWDWLIRLAFTFCFRMVGKSNSLWSKKIGAVRRVRAAG